MSIVLAEMRRTYAAQRAISQGASITLTSVSGGYVARFECATKAALVLGDRNLSNYEGTAPMLLIPTEDLHRSITKLSDTFSVALVDTTTDDSGTRFVLVWKILPRTPDTVTEAPADPHQASLNLDEY